MNLIESTLHAIILDFCIAGNEVQLSEMNEVLFISTVYNYRNCLQFTVKTEFDELVLQNNVTGTKTAQRMAQPQQI